MTSKYCIASTRRRKDALILRKINWTTLVWLEIFLTINAFWVIGFCVLYYQTIIFMGVYQLWATYALKPQSVLNMHFCANSKKNSIFRQKTAVDESAWIKSCQSHYTFSSSESNCFRYCPNSLQRSICTICDIQTFFWSVICKILVRKICLTFLTILNLWPMLTLVIFSCWNIKKGQYQFLVTFLAIFSSQ